MNDEKVDCIYILRCADNTLYTGWTNCLSARVKAHNSGKGAKYTKTRLPVELAYCEVYPCKEEALRRECAIKQLSRAQKLALIEQAPKAAIASKESVATTKHPGI